MKIHKILIRHFFQARTDPSRPPRVLGSYFIGFFKIFGRSVNPIPTGGEQIIPTYYYWPPKSFSPSGITVMDDVLVQFSGNFFIVGYFNNQTSQRILQKFSCKIYQHMHLFWKQTFKTHNFPSKIHLFWHKLHWTLQVWVPYCIYTDYGHKKAKPERIYNPITAMGFSAMFTFQLDNTKR